MVHILVLALGTDRNQRRARPVSNNIIRFSFLLSASYVLGKTLALISCLILRALITVINTYGAMAMCQDFIYLLCMELLNHYVVRLKLIEHRMLTTLQ